MTEKEPVTPLTGVRSSVIIPVKVATPRRIPKAPRVPKSKRIDVTRAEFDRVIDLLNERGHILNDLRHNLDIQFKRIATLQMEIDRLKSVVERKASARDS